MTDSKKNRNLTTGIDSQASARQNAGQSATGAFFPSDRRAEEIHGEPFFAAQDGGKPLSTRPRSENCEDRSLSVLGSGIPRHGVPSLGSV